MPYVVTFGCISVLTVLVWAVLGIAPEGPQYMAGAVIGALGMKVLCETSALVEGSK